MISGLQEEVHSVRAELRLLRTMFEEYKKETMEGYKKSNDAQQLSQQRFEDLSTKMVNILGSSERFADHIPGNMNGRSNNVTQQPTENVTIEKITTQMVTNDNRHVPAPFDNTNRFDPQLIPTTNTDSNIPVLRAIGYNALDQLVPSNRPHIPILEKQFPPTFIAIYEEYQRLNLYQFERNGSKNKFSTQQQSLFAKRYRAMKLIRIISQEYRPPLSIMDTITLLDNELKAYPHSMSRFLQEKYRIHGNFTNRNRSNIN